MARGPISPIRIRRIALGREAAAAIEVARDQVDGGARAARAGSLAFTSGATEALNWALKGTAAQAAAGAAPDRHPRDRACLRARHRANGSTGRASRSIVLAGRPDGLVDLDLARAPRSTTGTGSGRGDAGQQRDRRHPAGRRARRASPDARGALMLCDAVQGFGRVPIPREPRPGRRLRAQDPRAQGHRRAVDARRRRARRRCSTAAGRRGGMRSGTCRRRCASASARRRGWRPSARRGPRACRAPVGDRARRRSARAGPSTAAPSSAITAISTSAATGSTPRG